MRQKKNTKLILIIIVLLIVLIILAGVTFAYVATDTFKGNKELFFKYVSQIGNTQLKEYIEKRKDTPYSDDGTISVNITATNGQQQFNNINNINLTFNGQVDTANSKAEQNISLNYSENVTFPLIYRQIGNIIGIQTDYVGSKFVSIDTNQENSSIQGVDGIGKAEEFSQVEFTAEEAQRIKDTYFEIINNELQNSDFTKIQEDKSKGYKLTLNGEKLKSIIIKILENLKADNATLDKINEYMKIQRNSANIRTSDIDDMIEQLNKNTQLNSQNIEITVYQTKGKVTRLSIKTQEISINLEKTTSENDMQYNFEMQFNDSSIQKLGFAIKLSGLQSMQNIVENYQLSLETNEVNYQYNLDNTVQFAENVNIEDFNDNNSLLLNSLGEEQSNGLINAIAERIQAVNKKQMEELGLGENENPLQYIVPQLGISSSIGGIDEINEVEVNTFNAKFENYASTNLKGVTVKGLLSTIQLNNESQESEDRKIKEIHFDGEEFEATDQNITLLKGSVETETAYRVEFEKDENTGIIYRAVINKK